MKLSLQKMPFVGSNPIQPAPGKKLPSTHATTLPRDYLLHPLNIRRRLARPDRDRVTFPTATLRYRDMPPVADAMFRPATEPRLLRGAHRKLSGGEPPLIPPALPQSLAAIPAKAVSTLAKK